jgi:Xaa-Pro aminopeptidase
MEEFAIRRNKLIEHLAVNSVVILSSAKTQFRNGNIEHLFRQDSYYYYLTGHQENNAICVLIKGFSAADNKFILFGLPKVREEEIWTGFRIGQEEAKSKYKADEAYPIDKADEIIPQLLKNKQIVYFAFGNDSTWDQKIIHWVKLAGTKITKKARTDGEKITYIPNVLQDIIPIIAELRLYKSDQELKQIRTAANIASNGHMALMRYCKPDLYEYQLEATFAGYCMQHGCRALAYPAIVASGSNACILHYTQNAKQLTAGELVLIDAGGEYNYYSSDITRTIPVNGKFNPQQKDLYNVVLQAQLAGLKEIKPGNIFSKVQEVVVQNLVTGLLELGILQGNVEQLIQEQAYKKFYMHNASHWLGLDVHDVGDFYNTGIYRQFAPGMVLTIEPGLYIDAEDLSVEQKWRGIGIRIEDVVLVTPNGNEVLTSNLPKTVEDIEKIMQSNVN